MMIHQERPCHPDNYSKGRKRAVKYLVVHYVGALGNAAANAKYYGTTKGIKASAHYFVGHGPSPEIWASVAEADTAWHVGAKKYVHPDCRNDNAIGVELCCHQDPWGVWYFDPETVDVAVELCRDIVGRYGIPKDRVLRHYDVTGKICPAPFVHDAGAWEDFKNRVFAVEGQGHLSGPCGATSPKGEAKNDVPAEWAKVAWEKAQTTKGRDGKPILDGTRPTDTLTRQELAVVLDRLGFLKGGE